ncbi:hypothetical protein CLAIMM_08316 [Cladophialophora immunda]|nr:hypothetical protein CLAIMM_08316 [Cladophialophora immunda]
MSLPQLPHSGRRRGDEPREANPAGNGDPGTQNSQSIHVSDNNNNNGDNDDEVNGTRTRTDRPLDTSSLPSLTDLDSSLPSAYPRSVCSIIQDIESRLSGRSREDEPWKEYPLGVDDWKILRWFLDNCGWKVRFDYFSRIQTFVHRMPSTAHDTFIYQLCIELIVKVRNLPAGDQEREEFRRLIITHGSGDVKTTGSSTHSPDNFITHRRTPMYGLYIEFAWSQDRNRLPELAEFYMFESGRQTQVVIGIDCDSRRTKRVTLRCWRRSNPTGDQISEYVQVSTFNSRFLQ